MTIKRRQLDTRTWKFRGWIIIAMGEKKIAALRRRESPRFLRSSSWFQIKGDREAHLINFKLYLGMQNASARNWKRNVCWRVCTSMRIMGLVRWDDECVFMFCTTTTKWFKETFEKLIEPPLTWTTIPRPLLSTQQKSCKLLWIIELTLNRIDATWPACKHHLYEI